MYQPVDSAGLRRLVSFELNRLHPRTREEAHRAMTGRMGAYDTDGDAIEASIDAYFASQASAH
ncbi:hypothetical protein [Kordiimonas aestuarii]|uniref:hypothetical protein n=1 Tax=Kordiimonas aestuarii TaxID=1005925 RepID=UPI0021D28188|nr:hypothetical protein [Kordiimonas aestuarii]